MIWSSLSLSSPSSSSQSSSSYIIIITTIIITIIIIYHHHHYHPTWICSLSAVNSATCLSACCLMLLMSPLELPSSWSILSSLSCTFFFNSKVSSSKCAYLRNNCRCTATSCSRRCWYQERREDMCMCMRWYDDMMILWHRLSSETYTHTLLSILITCILSIISFSTL